MEPKQHSFPVPLYPPPEGGVIVGSNATDSPFAVIVEGDLGDRYLHGYELGGRLVWDLFRWVPQACVAVYEVRASQPVGEGSWKGTNDALQFRSPDDEFELALYQDGNAQVLEMSVGSIELRAGNQKLEVSGCSFLGNSVCGGLAMMHIGSDGSVGFGVGGSPPPGMVLLFADECAEVAA